MRGGGGTAADPLAAGRAGVLHLGARLIPGQVVVRPPGGSGSPPGGRQVPAWTFGRVVGVRHRPDVLPDSSVEEGILDRWDISSPHRLVTAAPSPPASSTSAGLREPVGAGVRRCGGGAGSRARSAWSGVRGAGGASDPPGHREEPPAAARGGGGEAGCGQAGGVQEAEGQFSEPPAAGLGATGGGYLGRRSPVQTGSASRPASPGPRAGLAPADPSP